LTKPDEDDDDKMDDGDDDTRQTSDNDHRNDCRVYTQHVQTCTLKKYNKN